jgi:transcriptional regulator with XRE-family HTH domain
MHRRIRPTDTLGSVRTGDSRYDDEYAARARAALKKFNDEHGQMESARLLGVNQSTISRNLSTDRQPSFKILILLSKATGRTIDEIIGLQHESRKEVTLSDSSLMRAAKAVAEEVIHKIRSDRPPPLPPKRPKKSRR